MSRLRLDGVVKVFGSGPSEVRALDGVCLEIGPGETVAVMGPSGAGKTTLLTIAGLLQQATSGSVEVDGTPAQHLSQAQRAVLRREHIGFVFQSFNLLQSLTALENVQYVLELNGHRGRASQQRATELLRMVGLGQRLHVRPVVLSGGEQQRVSVARALANNPAVVLADEPTANLDAQRAQETLGLLRALAGDMGAGVLIVTHDLRARGVCDRTLWLEDGHLRTLEKE